MGQRKKSIEVSDRNFKFNPSYDELQNVLVEMHEDAMNAFKTIGTQKRTILKLEAKIEKMRKDFENFKNKHASLGKELFAIPPKESVTIDVPKFSKTEDINTCGGSMPFPILSHRYPINISKLSSTILVVYDKIAMIFISRIVRCYVHCLDVV